MRNYREHLGVPVLWWILIITTAATFAWLSWAGFNLLIGVILFVVLVLGPAAGLGLWGWSVIEVSAGELRAGKASLPLALAGAVQALDEDQTAKMRGPMADPAAFMWVRPYLRHAVYIEITGDNPERPYWLIGTRHPRELAQAIDRSRPQYRAGDTRMA